MVGGTWCKWAGPMFARASCPACSFGSVALVVMVCADGAEAQGRQADDSGLIVGCAHCSSAPAPALTPRGARVVCTVAFTVFIAVALACGKRAGDRRLDSQLEMEAALGSGLRVGGMEQHNTQQLQAQVSQLQAQVSQLQAQGDASPGQHHAVGRFVEGGEGLEGAGAQGKAVVQGVVVAHSVATTHVPDFDDVRLAQRTEP